MLSIAHQEAVHGVPFWIGVRVGKRFYSSRGPGLKASVAPLAALGDLKLGRINSLDQPPYGITYILRCSLHPLKNKFKNKFVISGLYLVIPLDR